MLPEQALPAQVTGEKKPPTEVEGFFVLKRKRLS